MFGLMLALFICSCVYYLIAVFDLTMLFFQAVADNPLRVCKQWSWGHLFLILINIFITVVSVLYCFCGVR